MKRIPLEDLLAEMEFFDGMSKDYILLLARCAKLHDFAAGEILFAEGDPASCCHLIRSGRVAIGLHVPGEGPVVLATEGPGEMLGWSWLYPPHRWHFDAEAVEKTSTITLDALCLRDSFDEHPDLGYAFMMRFAHTATQRLVAARFQLLDIYGRNASHPQTTWHVD